MHGSVFIALKLAVRHLIASRGHAIAAVLSLAIGIAGLTTTFTWVDQMLLRPLPGVRDPGSLFVLMSRSLAGVPGNLSYPDYQELRAGADGFAEIAATGFSPVTFSERTGAPVERVFAELVSDNYFRTLDATPALGRVFQADEATVPDAHPVAVLSDGFWRQRLAGDPNVLGRTVLLNGRVYTIIGVMQPAFHGAFVATDTNLWTPLVMQRDVAPGDLLTARGSRWLQGLVRIASDGRPDELRARVDAVSQRLLQNYASVEQGRTFLVSSLWRSPVGAQAVLRPVLFGLAGLAALLLLLACANVGNLVLARALQRRRNVAIRRSLGASRLQAVMPWVAEAFVLTTSGGIAGLLLADWAVRLLPVFQPPAAFTGRLDVEINAASVLLVVVAIVGCTSLLGLVPILPALRESPAGVLRAESESVTAGRVRRRLNDLLTSLQIGVCVAVLIGTGLSLRSFSKSRDLPLGFAPDHVLLAGFDLFPKGYGDDAGMARQEQILERVAHIPGVISVSLGSMVPFGLGGRAVVPIAIDGYTPRVGEDMQAIWNVVGPGYLRTMGVPLERGREFTPRDRRPSGPVAMVSHALAAHYWSEGDAVGKRLRVRGQVLEIVGVAADVRYETLQEPPPMVVYVSALQWYRPATTLHMKLSETGNVLPELRRALAEIEPAIPLLNVRPLAAHMEAASFTQRLAATLSLVLVIPCIVLTAVGIHSMLSYTVEGRRTEIGLRIALGAQQADVVRLLARHVVPVTAAGLAFGLLAGAATAALLASTLVGVDARDPGAWIAGPALVLVLSIVSGWVVTGRAIRISPRVALGR
jgi:predicted permease